MHSCEVEISEASLTNGLHESHDENVKLLTEEQLLGMVGRLLQVVEGGGFDGFEPLSLQDRNPPNTQYVPSSSSPSAAASSSSSLSHTHMHVYA